ncbi:4-sulfomuconolactone hydrolase [Polystyrenella longa]|uniref:4-sulfomuconolactone hydrolase n=1 Tax=Polystyrenella longa TaxID=2528007 RepID=A0A518CRR9_9PLAN|nr:amidohydrolase family protein [Polystyrenella longa]QDU81926.1 4-sulfomuconolactone hydrolase [Polystyrenella longa]
MVRIDAHSHVWTPDTMAYPLAPGWRKANMDPASFTTEELLEHMHGSNVDKTVLIQMSFYGYDNSYMLDSIRKHPGKFAGVAVIDQDTGRVDMEMRKQQGLGVTGFRIFPKNQTEDSWLSSEAMHTMFQTGAEEKLNMCCLIDAVHLVALDRMCRDFPDTPVVIDHMARIGVDGNIRETEVNQLCAMARHPHVTVKVSAFYALGKKEAPYRDLSPLIKQLYQAFGPERLMWATDCPFQAVQPHTYKASLELVERGLDFLSASDREWLLGKTAERVFFAHQKR